MKYLPIRSFCLCLLCMSSLFGLHGQKQTSLRERFLNPPEEAKPWTFWYWMYGAVSREGITADLQAMAQAGLGGAYLMPIRGVEEGKQYNGTVQQLTPEWWEMVDFSMQEADRLGLKLGMHICDGFALAGGPWITPQESMQKVVWSDTIVKGGRIKDLQLPLPENYKGYYEDIALFALPIKGNIGEAKPRITCVDISGANGVDASKKVQMDATGVIRSSYPCYIQYEYDHSFTCRNIEVILSGNNYQAHRLRVMASDDGINFRFVKQLVPARQGWQNTDENSTHAIPPTTARYFRFYWTPEGSEPGSEDLDAAKWKPNLKIKELRLHQEARLNQWEGKAGLVWRVAPETRADELKTEECYQLSQMIDLTTSFRCKAKRTSTGKTLTATLPPGHWKLLRMGHTSTGHVNATAGGGKGLECDKFSAVAVRKQLHHWFAQVFLQTNTEVARRTLQYIHVDSWECGSQNWSKEFAQSFKRRRGYDLKPYLPLLAGIPIESVERSEAILRDVRNTIAELVADVFYQEIAKFAKENNLQLSAECVAPTMVSDGLLHYKKVDLPMGEFWLDSPTHDKPNDILDAISGARIYGKRIVQAEGFTQIRGTWHEHPGMLKSLLDRNYALGVNRLFYHVFVHNPWLDRKPGMTLEGIGLFFQRDQTWWNKGAKAFSSYAARCQALLQYGSPVTDIAVFTGEEIPSRAVLPERLLPSLPGVFGAERVENERKRLENSGQPLRTRPVGVTHSANMADPEKWVNPLRGYAYDSFNKDALLHRAGVRNGRMVLAEGSEGYKVVVFPLSRPMNPNPIPISPEIEAKKDELKDQGIIIPQLPYVENDFSLLGLEPDIVVPEQVAWTHRKGEMGEFYFIANQQEETRKFSVSMRIAKGRPECWYPVAGCIDSTPAYKQSKSRTELTLTLAPHESVFVVFPQEERSNEPTNLHRIERDTTQSDESFVQSLSGLPYTVEFLENGKSLARKELFDWSSEEDAEIRYYSGTAVYRMSFQWSQTKKSHHTYYLNLGTIYNIATIRLNGNECGTVWTPPYRSDITEALKDGENILEVEVSNTWANALQGADKGQAPFPGIWTNAKYRKGYEDLLPSGLVGPMTITTN